MFFCCVFEVSLSRKKFLLAHLHSTIYYVYGKAVAARIHSVYNLNFDIVTPLRIRLEQLAPR